MLADVCAAIATALETLEDVDTIHMPPSPKMGGKREINVYAVPGMAEVEQQPDGAGLMTFTCRDLIVIEWRVALAGDQIDLGWEEAMGVIDAIRLLIMKSYAETGFDDTVRLVHGLDVETVGKHTWGNQNAFGVRFLLDLTHEAQTSGF